MSGGHRYLTVRLNGSTILDMTTTTYKSLFRRPPGRDTQVQGPWHAMTDAGLSLCGKRLRGLNSRTTTDRPDESTMCDLCLAHQRAGTRQAYRRH